jgi:hypothetical protein
MVSSSPKRSRLECDKTIALAIRDLEDSAVSSVSEAARKHNVADTTLCDRMKGNSTLFSRQVQGLRLGGGRGRGPLVHVDRVDNSGFPLRPEMIDVCPNYV